ncbi:hypothetical protein [Microbacterium sp. NPDC055683]
MDTTTNTPDAFIARTASVPAHGAGLRLGSWIAIGTARRQS